MHQIQIIIWFIVIIQRLLSPDSPFVYHDCLSSILSRSVPYQLLGRYRASRVDTELVGLILGRRRANLRYILTESGARVNIIHELGMTRFEILGRQTQTIKAVSMLIKARMNALERIQENRLIPCVKMERTGHCFHGENCRFLHWLGEFHIMISNPSQRLNLLSAAVDFVDSIRFIMADNAWYGLWF